MILIGLRHSEIVLSSMGQLSSPILKLRVHKILLLERTHTSLIWHIIDVTSLKSTILFANE